MYLSVPFAFTEYILDRLVNKINAVILNNISPNDIVNNDSKVQKKNKILVKIDLGNSSRKLTKE